MGRLAPARAAVPSPSVSCGSPGRGWSWPPARTRGVPSRTWQPSSGRSSSAPPRRPAQAPRFPLLVKLLDPAGWLSVQVHPDDALAHRLGGPDAVGKAEAWYVIEADPDAELLVGVRPSVREADLREAMRRGAATTDLLARQAVAAGDAVMIPPGTLHAVGPGVLLYEVQQPSDLTYRVDDWGRPATPDRPLHTAEALAAVAPDSRPAVRRGGDRRTARELPPLHPGPGRRACPARSGRPHGAGGDGRRCAACRSRVPDGMRPSTRSRRSSCPRPPAATSWRPLPARVR